MDGIIHDDSYSLLPISEYDSKLVWVPDSQKVWVIANHIRSEIDNHICQDITNRERTYKVSVKQYPKLLPVVISTIKTIVSNLIWLEDMNDGAILHQVRRRFETDKIYTNVGSFLVIVNPFKLLPIYGFSNIKVWANALPLERSTLEPHVYGVAAKALRNMFEYNVNQSIVITGVSGAGKTEAVKAIIRYVGEVTNSSSREGERILLMNPILESFGNSKTVRNNNSSRFGKWMEILFNKMGKICGARIVNFLLEKTRVAFLSENERNYHIFYQLCSGASSEDKKRMSLKPASYYRFLNTSGCYDIPNVNDAEGYKELIDAILTMGFDNEECSSLMDVVASVLHLGNISFEPSKIKQKRDADLDGCKITSSTYEDLVNASKLLVLDPKDLEKALCFRESNFGSERIAMPLKVSDAVASVEALAKSLYSDLFDYIIKQMNSRLIQNENTNKVIGILDIFGFEIFTVNSFEQFCINYANEKLQYYMNYHIFATEQNEYMKEGITYVSINFTDNKPCLELIEKSPHGIIPTLTEEAIMKSFGDDSLINKLHKYHGDKKTGHSHYGMDFKRPNVFIVKHFCAAVTYTIDGFVAKNLDYLHDSMKSVLLLAKSKIIRSIMKDASQNLTRDSNTSNQSLSSIMEETSSITSNGGGSLSSISENAKAQLSPKNEEKEKKSPRFFGFFNSKSPRASVLASSFSGQKTISSTFMTQLGDLMKTLKATEAHYIRCIRPNETNSPNTFDAIVVNEQLKNCGIYETVKLRRMGFCYRIKHLDFLRRYAVCVSNFNDYLTLSSIISDSELAFKCKTFLMSISSLRSSTVGWQVGKTKVFLNENIHPLMENIRSKKLSKLITRIQRATRKWLARKQLSSCKTSNEKILKAMESKKVDVIRQVLTDLFGDIEEISEDQAVNIPAVAQARELLLSIPQEEILIDLLTKAINSNDIFSLDSAIDTLKEKESVIIKNNDKLLQLYEVAQKQFNKLIAISEVKRQLDHALQNNKLESIEVAILAAKNAGLDAKILQEAVDICKQLRRETNIKRDIKTSINDKNILQLRLTLEDAESLKLTKMDAYIEGKAFLKKVIDENLLNVETSKLIENYKINYANDNGDFSTKFNTVRSCISKMKKLGLDDSPLRINCIDILNGLEISNKDQFLIEESFFLAQDYFDNIFPLDEAIQVLTKTLSEMKSISIADREKGEALLIKLQMEEEALINLREIIERTRDVPNITIALDSISEAVERIINKEHPEVKIAIQNVEDLKKMVELSELSIRSVMKLTKVGTMTSKKKINELNSLVRMNEKLGFKGDVAQDAIKLHKQYSTSLFSDIDINLDPNYEKENVSSAPSVDKTLTVDFVLELLQKCINIDRTNSVRILMLQNAIDCARIVGIGTDNQIMIQAIMLFIQLRRDSLYAKVDIPPPPGLGFNSPNVDLLYSDESTNEKREQLKLAISSKNMLLMQKSVKDMISVATYLPELTQVRNIVNRYEKGMELLQQLETSISLFERTKIKLLLPKLEALNIEEYLSQAQKGVLNNVIDIARNISASQYYRENIRVAIKTEDTSKIKLIISKANKCGEALGKEWEKDARLASLIIEGEESIIRGRGKSVLFGPAHAKPVTYTPKLKTSLISQSKNVDWRTFVSIRTPGNYAKRIFFKGKVKLLMFRYTKDIIPRSLYAFESKQLVKVADNTTLSISRYAVELFKTLQIVMGDRYHEYPILMAHEIISQGFLVENIRDEIYLQILKQTSLNPDKDSLMKGWKMLFLCLLTFPPSNAFSDYLRSYIYSHTIVSEVAKWDGENTYEGGTIISKDQESTTLPICKFSKIKSFAKKVLPALEEIINFGCSSVFPSLNKAEAIFQNKRSVVIVYLPDGSCINLAVPISRFTMRVSELMHYIIPMTSLKEEDVVAYGIYECTISKLIENVFLSLNKKERMLTNREPVIDVVQSWARVGQNEDKGNRYALVLKRAIFSKSDIYNPYDAYLIQSQIAGDVVAGKYSMSDKSAVRLVAMQLLINRKREKKTIAINVSKDFETALKPLLDRYLPQNNRDLASNSMYWIDLLNVELNDLESIGFSVDTQQLSQMYVEYISYVKTLSGFGIIEFNDMEQLVPEIPEDKDRFQRITVKEDMLNIISKNSGEATNTLVIPLHEVTSYTDEGEIICLSVHIRGKGVCEYKFKTSRSQELVQVIYSFTKRSFAKKLLDVKVSSATFRGRTHEADSNNQNNMFIESLKEGDLLPTSNGDDYISERHKFIASRVRSSKFKEFNILTTSQVPPGLVITESTYSSPKDKANTNFRKSIRALAGTKKFL